MSTIGKKIKFSCYQIRLTFHHFLHILLGSVLLGGGSMADLYYADVDDMIFAEEVSLPSDR